MLNAGLRTWQRQSVWKTARTGNKRGDEILKIASFGWCSGFYKGWHNFYWLGITVSWTRGFTKFAKRALSGLLQGLSAWFFVFLFFSFFSCSLNFLRINFQKLSRSTDEFQLNLFGITAANEQISKGAESRERILVWNEEYEIQDVAARVARSLPRAKP